VSKLDGKPANAARRAMDQYGLSRGKLRMVEQSLPGGQRGQGNGGSLGKIQSPRFRCEIGGGNDNILGVGTVSPLPAIPGHEFAGIVETIGLDATNIEVGDAVYALADFWVDLVAGFVSRGPKQPWTLCPYQSQNEAYAVRHSQIGRPSAREPPMLPPIPEGGRIQ
jgi:hypothetical protein